MKYLKMFYRKKGIVFLIIPLFVTVVGSVMPWIDNLEYGEVPFEAKVILSTFFVLLFVVFNIRNYLIVKTDVKMTKKYGPGWRKYIE